MAKYRLLNKNRYSNSRFEWGLIYDESYMGQRYPVKTLVANYPRDWELIKEEPMYTETIIGYELKDNLWENDYRKGSFLQGVCKIGLIPGDNSIKNINECTTPKSQSVIDNFKAAKVLDLWFTPVYKSEYPDITINGYKGEFFDNYVKFGCAEIHKQIFLSFDELNARINDGDDPIGAKTNKEIELVTIGRGMFTKDQIKEIAEYYLNK